MKRRKYLLERLRSSQKIRPFAYIAAFASIGIVALVLTKAATPTASFEPESSASKVGVTTSSSSAASNGSYIRFGSGSSGGGYTTMATKPGGWAWQWQLTGTISETALDGSSNPNKMIDIDWENATAAVISRLKAKGIYVVCYVESGDWAEGRGDADDYAASILGNGIDGFSDEKYVKVNMLDGPAGPTGKTLRQIMQARLQTAKNKGCQGIEPDLDDLHTYGPGELGFNLNMTQMVTYNKAIIDMGHALGMSVGLKNGADGGGSGSFTKAMYDAGADWVLNEECNQFEECDGYEVFINGGRPVFQVEYLDNQDTPYSGANGTCARNNTAGYDGIVKDSSSSLSASPRIPCRAGN